MAALVPLAFNARAESTEDPNSGAGARPSGLSGLLAAVTAPAAPLEPIVSEQGLISYSIDAIGTNAPTGADVEVQKPAGGSVRRAYMFATSTGFTGYRITDSDIAIEGSPVAWDVEMASSISSYNYAADVTDIVKPTLDAAPSGPNQLRVTEANTAGIDGEVLVVVFDDPNQSDQESIVLYFGAQDWRGSSYYMHLLEPYDPADGGLQLSLGISFGCQGAGCGGGPSAQYSTIDVNGQRLTTSAGGYDDGVDGASNGALITTGGVGDEPANPQDPNATTSDSRYDDELYDITDFVPAGTDSIRVDVENPSADDNIFFSALSGEVLLGTGTNFADWHSGDVHVHAAGDSGLGGHYRCSGLEEKAQGGGHFADECPERLVDQTYDRADDNGSEFVVYTEHGPWLGMYRRTFCTPLGGPCQTVVNPLRWEGKQARQQYDAIRDAADSKARTDKTVRPLMGQELGSAGALCKANAVNAGHFGAYFVPSLVDNGQLDCVEPDYLENVRSAGGWGATNHPDNGDGGSDWHCWYDGDVQPASVSGSRECESGAADYSAFEAVEIVNDNHLPSIDVLDQFDNLLQNGERIAAVGGGDAHTAARSSFGVGQSDGNDGKIGLRGRTYTHVRGNIRPTSSFRSDDASDPVRRAIRNGATIASNGPLIVPSVSGVLAGGTASYSGDTANLRVVWPKQPAPILSSGNGEIDPNDPAPIGSLGSTPDEVIIVTGSTGSCPEGDDPCGLDVTSITPTATDVQRGWIEHVISTADLANRAFVRVEALYDLVGANSRYRNSREYRYGAYSSPIFLNRGTPQVCLIFCFPVPNPTSTASTGSLVIQGRLHGAAASLADSVVEVCDTASGECLTTVSDPSGAFAVADLGPGTYTATAFPSANADFYLSSRATVELADSPGSTVDIEFETPGPLPVGTEIAGSAPTPDGVPRTWAGTSPELRTTACAGAASTLSLSRYGVPIATDVAMTEAGGGGTYVANLPLPSNVGPVAVDISIDCPTGDDEQRRFDLHVLPSAGVVDTSGAPITGAVVTLLTRDSTTGAYVPVPDNSAVMSPGNRANPSSTDVDGRVGWHAVVGDYRVRATARDCRNPDDPGSDSVVSDAFTSSAELATITLELDCSAPTVADLTIHARVVSGAEAQVFTYDIVCTLDGIQVYDATTSIDAGASEAIPGLPVGALCRVTQQEVGNHRALEGAEQDVTVEPGSAVYFTNTDADPQPLDVSLRGLSNHATVATTACEGDELGTIDLGAGETVLLDTQVLDGSECVVDFAFETGGPVKGSVSTIVVAPETTITLERQPNFAPTAVVDATPTAGPAPLNVTFDASGSVDADGEIVQYDWDFEGDGIVDEVTTESATAHVYPEKGSFSATVTVTDDEGATTSSDSPVVQVGVQVGADSIELNFRGSFEELSYSGPILGGDLTVEYDSIGLTRVSGTAEIPGATATNATVGFEINRFAFFSFWVGVIIVRDPAAGREVSHLHLFGSTSFAAPDRVSGVSNWFDFRSLFTSYTLRWSVTDRTG